MPDHKQNAIKAFIRELKKTIDADRVYTDELRRLAWGADAGFYHLIPKVVVRAKNREEVSIILRMASDYHLPVTFRAAGTSLSGQAIESPAEAIPSQDALTPDETAPVNEESAPEPPSIL